MSSVLQKVAIRLSIGFPTLSAECTEEVVDFGYHLLVRA
jgi:hypothetical protein